MSAGVRIIYEESGFPRDLIDFREWTRAVASGSLRPETLVTVHRDGEPATVLPAGALPELRAIFAPETTAPVTAMPPSDSDDAAALIASGASGASGADASSVPVPEEKPERSEPLAATGQPTRSPTAAEPPHASASPARDGIAKWVLAAVAGVLLLLLVATNLFRTGKSVEPTPTPEATRNQAAPVDAAQAIAEGTAIEWTETGTPKTYVTEGLEITLSAKADGAGSVPVMTVRSADLGDSSVVGVAGGETAHATFVVLRPSRLDRVPSVLLMTYTMGAHCCTSFKLLTPRGAGWTLADLGQWDGEPWATAPTDLNDDGLLDFVMHDNAFLYAFTSYAESWTPSLIYNVIGGRFVDRTSAPSFRAVHLADMKKAEVACARHENGACAAMVGSAARIGEQASAFQFAVGNHNAAATQGWLPARCLQITRDGSCPAGSEQQPSGFAEALDWFLQDHGYVSEPIAPATIPVPDTKPDATPAEVPG